MKYLAKPSNILNRIEIFSSFMDKIFTGRVSEVGDGVKKAIQKATFPYSGYTTNTIFITANDKNELVVAVKMADFTPKDFFAEFTAGDIKISNKVNGFKVHDNDGIVYHVIAFDKECLSNNKYAADLADDISTTIFTLDDMDDDMLYRGLILKVLADCDRLDANIVGINMGHILDIKFNYGFKWSVNTPLLYSKLKASIFKSTDIDSLYDIINQCIFKED